MYLLRNTLHDVHRSVANWSVTQLRPFIFSCWEPNLLRGPASRERAEYLRLYGLLRTHLRTPQVLRADRGPKEWSLGHCSLNDSPVLFHPTSDVRPRSEPGQSRVFPRSTLQPDLRHHPEEAFSIPTHRYYVMPSFRIQYLC